MKKFLFTIAILLIFITTSARSDFGGFSGNNDYSRSSSSSSSSSSRSSRSSSSSSSRSSSSYSGSSSRTRNNSRTVYADPSETYHDEEPIYKTPSRNNVPTIYADPSETYHSEPIRQKNIPIPIPMPITIPHGTNTRPVSSNLGATLAPRNNKNNSDNDDNSCVGALVLLVIIYFVYKSWRNGAKQKAERNNSPIILPEIQQDSHLNPMEDYIIYDPSFDAEELTEHLGNLYVQLQEAWTKKDLEPVRQFMTDKFFNQMKRQLKFLIQQNRTDHTENIAVLDVNLIGWYQLKSYDYIVARLNTRITSYITDDNTGEIVSGSRTREKFMEYEWKLCRRTSTMTENNNENLKINKCPNCGAPIDINSSTKCQYCGTIIISKSVNWTISGMTGISQRTA